MGVGKVSVNNVRCSRLAVTNNTKYCYPTIPIKYLKRSPAFEPPNENVERKSPIPAAVVIRYK